MVSFNSQFLLFLLIRLKAWLPRMMRVDSKEAEEKTIRNLRDLRRPVIID